MCVFDIGHLAYVESWLRESCDKELLHSPRFHDEPVDARSSSRHTKSQEEEGRLDLKSEE